MNYIKKLVLFIVVFLSLLNSTKAMTPTVDYLIDIYSNRIGNDKLYSGQLGYIRMDGKIIYCVDPYSIVGKDYTLNNNYLNNFSKEDLLYMNLVAHHAKGYIDNDNNWFYYMAAQELIWEKIIGKNKIYYTTAKNGQGTRFDTSAFKDDLDNFAKNFLVKPSFDKTVVKDNFYSIIVLEDTNNVLYNYSMINESKNEVWIEDNKLYIKILSSELGKIKFEKRLSGSGVKYYRSDSNQDIVDFDDDIIYTSEVTVQANNQYSESLFISFLDDETNKNIDGGIKFKIINLDSGEESSIYTTYNSSYYIQDKYESGNYKIELIDVPKNYFIDDNTYFEIKEEQNYMEVKNVICRLKKSKGKIIINNNKANTKYKLYSTNNIYDENNNMVFKKNSLIDEIEVLKSNKYETDILPFGKYYLIDESDGERYDIELEYEDNKTELVIKEINLEDKIIDSVISNDNLLPEKPEEEKNNNLLPEKEKNDSIQNQIDEINHGSQPDKENISKKYLPNTINYIKIIKILIIVLIILLIFKTRKNEK